ncbi:MAG: membrane protein insertase YidC [Spirochaetes bacterium]|nr:membrane protein insertase YidC [Spirochaetota bacterium]
MDKRFALALGLSLIVWFVWMLIFNPVPQQQRSVETQNDKSKLHKTQISSQKPVNTTSTSNKVTSVQSARDEINISLSTKLFTVTMTNRGAAINNFQYSYNGKKIELVVEQKDLLPKGINAKSNLEFPVYFTESEFFEGNIFNSSLWNVEKTSENSVNFYLIAHIHDGQQIRFDKTFVFYPEKNYFELHHSIKNIGTAPITFPENRLIMTTPDFLGPAMDFDNRYNHVEIVYFTNNSFETGSQGGGLFTDEQMVRKEIGETKWAGVRSRYFLLLMAPQGFTGTGIIHDGRNNHGKRVGIFVPIATLQKGETVTKTFKIYVGEKNKQKLVEVDESLRDAADINVIIEPIRDFLVWCLLKINLLIGNFGWSLIVFSILTKIALMPLTIKSMESMKRMQELAPKVKEIQTKYKDKPDIMNKKIMDLYKKEKVNPLGGCLPLLLQLPFFFALYSALVNSIDLWKAPFIFWIKDLSLPDTVATIAGFNINILPLVMTLTTYLQQKMTPGSESAQQQIMIKLMPFIFLFIFWNMPSGLILYWIMQNILQILHQLYINQKAKKELQEGGT